MVEPNGNHRQNDRHGGRGHNIGFLKNEHQKRLLIATDQLRGSDIDHQFELPQLVVCGKQSSGKSSILEALSGVPFPRNSGTCTRFATVLRFRHDGPQEVTATLTLDDEAKAYDDEEKVSLTVKAGVDGLGKVIADAERLLRDRGKQNSKKNPPDEPKYYKSVLTLEVGGSDIEITIVDLPGLIQLDAHKGERAGEDIKRVEDIVDKWLKEKRSIILAVVTANDDAQNQKVLHKAKEFDPTGDRSFGIITKPDIEDQSGWVETAKNENEEFKFKKGWHVLRNRSQNELSSQTSAKSRDDNERKFFEDHHEWKAIGKKNLGIEALRERLGTMLYEHTKAQLPSVIAEVRAQVEKYEGEISKLEESLKAKDEKWGDFRDRCNHAVDIIKSAVDGHYEDNSGFFRINDPDDSRYLWRGLQDSSDEFEEQIRTAGYDSTLPWDSSEHFTDKLIEKVHEELKRTIGRELKLQGDSKQRLNLLFHSRSEKWQELATKYLDGASAHCQKLLGFVIDKLFLEDFPGLKDVYLKGQVFANLGSRKEKAAHELQNLEDDRRRPMNTRSKRFEQQCKDAEDKTLYAIVFKAIARVPDSKTVTPAYLSEKMDLSDEEQRRRADAEKMLKKLFIYYDIARDIFVDNVMNQVVERHLLADLHHIFQNSFNLTKDTFVEKWKDNGFSRREAKKSQLERKRANLNTCLEELLSA